MEKKEMREKREEREKGEEGDAGNEYTSTKNKERNNIEWNENNKKIVVPRSSTWVIAPSKSFLS